MPEQIKKIVDNSTNSQISNNIVIEFPENQSSLIPTSITNPNDFIYQHGRDIQTLMESVKNIQNTKYIEINLTTSIIAGATFTIVLTLLGALYSNITKDILQNSQDIQEVRSDIKNLTKSEKYHELDKRITVLENNQAKPPSITSQTHSF